MDYGPFGDSQVRADLPSQNGVLTKKAFDRFLTDENTLSSLATPFQNVTTSQPAENCAKPDIPKRHTNNDVTDWNPLKPAATLTCDVVTDWEGGVGEKHPIPAKICIKCGGALDTQDKGQAWLIDNGEARHKGECPGNNEAARIDAEERAAIQTEANTRPTQREKNQDDPLREFDEWIRSEPSKPNTKSDT